MTSRRAVPGHRILGFLATAPIAIPGIVLGVGLFLSYTRPPFVLYGTLWILLVAYVTIELPSAYQQMRSAFHAVNPELEEASRILGATRMQVLSHITGGARAIRRDHPLHVRDQGCLGIDFRFEGKRRSSRHRGARIVDAGIDGWRRLSRQ
jgi:Binding-protein-dependent transport system inner membrane component